MSGFRRLKLSSLKIDQAQQRAEQGQGASLSKNAVRDMVRRCAPALGLHASQRLMLMSLLEYTNAVDWEEGAVPLVWPSNRELSEILGRSERQVINILNDLNALGLIAFKHSPNGRRFGHRGANGAIVEAFGLDLSPLNTRAMEIEASYNLWQAERQALLQAKRARTILRRTVVMYIQVLMEQDVATESFEERLSDLLDAPCSTRTSFEQINQALDGLLNQIKALAIHLLNTPKTNDKSQNTSPKTAVEFTSLQDSEIDHLLKKNGAYTPCSENTSRSGYARPKNAVSLKKSDFGDVTGHNETSNMISLELLCQAAPIVNLYALEPLRNWAEVVRLASQLKAGLQINLTTWERATSVMGPIGAAASLFYVLHLRESQKLNNARNAGAYFNKLISLYETGAYEPLAALQSSARSNLTQRPDYLE
jgi:replication initiation protein RepC